MTVLVLSRDAQGHGRAHVRGLQRLGVPVIHGLERLPSELREDAERAAASVSELTLAISSRSDFADHDWLDLLNFAFLNGALSIVALDGPSAPANQSGVEFVASTEERVHPLALAKRVTAALMEEERFWPRGPDEETAPHAAQEARDFLKAAHKTYARAQAYVEFLRRHPGGVFEHVARRALDAETRAVRYERSGLSKGALADARRVWRLGGGSSIGRRRAAAGLGLLAAAIALGLSWFVWAPRPSVRAHALPIQIADASGSRPASARGLIAPAPAQLALGAPRFEARPISDPEQAPPEGALSSIREPNPLPAPVAETASATSTTIDPNGLSSLDAGITALVERARRTEDRAKHAARDDRGPRIDRVVRVANAAAIYRGEWSGEAANGLGVARSAQGVGYAGAWRDSRPDGYGVMRFSNGARFEGLFIDGSPTARGVLWDASGRRIQDRDLFAVLMEAQREQ